ncbi:hypothetical protein CALVIDRAFT_329018 [Calocera viscosa TUFC12733]|uniref:F-box domain-containing protein n=1 Tax=Calocera viscosa (strain TUFC12733) TaxID=1330018 RepID=A0A167HU83_CALVF|nr:hypothetical protein CALVIDRAFT_329018 [Calocera viscosa TUFC12733]
MSPVRTLNDLPLDFTDIFWRYEIPVADLATLAGVSRASYMLFNPLLYRIVRITSPDARLFMKIVQQHSHLVQYTRELHVLVVLFSEQQLSETLQRLKTLFHILSVHDNSLQILHLSLSWARHTAPPLLDLWESGLQLLQSVFPPMVRSLNTLRVPLLRTLDAELDFWPWGEAIVLDLRPLLEKVLRLEVVDVPLNHLPLPATALPNLRTFVGNTQDCLTICDGSRPLHTLDLSLPFPDYDLTVMTNGCQDSTALLSRFALTTTLQRLFLVHGGRQDVGINSGDRGYLPLATFHRLARSCPNLTHLEVCVDGSMEEIASVLQLLRTLRWVRIRLRHAAFASARREELERTILKACPSLRFIWLENHGAAHMAEAFTQRNAATSSTFLVERQAYGSFSLKSSPYGLSELMRRYNAKDLDV